MDALFKIAVESLDGTWANRNFIALLAIIYQLRSQKLTFNGMFNVQDEKITKIDEKATKAEKKSSENEVEVASMKPKVTELWKNLVEDKMKKAKD